MADLNQIMQILQANKEKQFVKRILQKDLYSVLNLPSGDVATHKMAWGEANGKFLVFPTIRLQEDKSLKQLKGNEAFNSAIKDREFIEFDSAKEAEYFSQHYKDIWK